VVSPTRLKFSLHKYVAFELGIRPDIITCPLSISGGSTHGPKRIKHNKRDSSLVTIYSLAIARFLLFYKSIGTSVSTVYAFHEYIYGASTIVGDPSHYNT